jgi:ABC-type bacteriocin/lantibiotic exporter with double-glycine peptidase domain
VISSTVTAAYLPASKSLSGVRAQHAPAFLPAHALYQEPSILILDEATSDLDVATEQHIAEVVAELHIAQVFAAHRPDTMAIADHLISLSCSGVMERDGVPRKARLR